MRLFFNPTSTRSRWVKPFVLALTAFCAISSEVRADWHPTIEGTETAPPVDLLTCARRNRVFYQGQNVTFFLGKDRTQNGILSRTFKVCNYYGALVASGSVTPTGASATVALGQLPLGWYKVSLFGGEDRSRGGQGYSPGPWGAATGGTTFCVLRPDPHFPTMPDTDTPNTSSVMLPNDEVARGVLALGPQRHSIGATLVGNANRFDIPAINKSVGVDIGLDHTWYLAQQDAVRPRAELGHIVNGVPGFATGNPDYAGLRQIVTNFKNDVKYWEPRNEPQHPDDVAAGMAFAQNEFKPFRDNVKLADPTAKVLGANTVGIRSGDLGWLAGFMQGGGDRMMDGFSFHAYNTVNGDLALGRASMNALQDFLKKYGLQDIEKWQTEQGHMAAHFGTFTPRVQGRGTMMQRMLFEQYNLPKEHDVMWYDKSHGFWGVPVWYENNDTSLNPAAPLMRVYSEELWGKSYVRALDFGPSGNNSTIGNVFSGGLIVLMSAGNTNGQVQLQNAGGASATDAWGNPVSVSTTGNITTVPVNELPVYVHNAGANAEVVKPNWGPNLLRQPGVTISAPGTGQDKLRNGQMETWYYNQPASGGKLDSAESPWNAGTTAPTAQKPISVEVGFSSAKTVRRVVIYAAPPWQNQSTLLDYDLQAWDGTNWNTIETVQQPENTQKVWTPTTRTTVESYFSDRWIFEHSFAAVTTTKLRLLVRKVTCGGLVNQDDLNATADKAEQRLVLREIEAYEDAPKIYSIAGRVKDLTGGEVKGLASAQVQLSGFSSATTTTDADGYYRFDNLRGGGDFTVTPSKSGQVFLPVARSTQNLSTDTTLDFQNPNGEGLTGDYFKSADLSNFKVSRLDPQINFDWGYSGPFCAQYGLTDGACGNQPMQDPTGIGIGEFSVRWSGQVQALSTETYTFRTSTDDGVRLWINGQLLIDNFSTIGARDNSATVALEEGHKYNVRMDYLEINNTSKSMLFWSTPTRREEVVPQRALFPLGKGMGLRGQYFGAPDFTQLKKTRIDRSVNFNWGAGSPDATVPNNAFSVRWTGFIEPRTSENTTFYTTSDNGLRLWVNDQLVIDNWNPNIQTEKTSATVALQKGVKVSIKIEYFEDSANAAVVLKWNTPTQAKEIIPQSALYPSGGTGVGAEYFDNADFTASKQKRVDPQINFNWGLGSPDASIDPETFSVRWKAKIEPVFSEDYTFSTLTDERVKLWVNGQLLVDKWDDHTAKEDTASQTVTLVGGQKYDLKMEFADIRSFAQAKLFWSSASQPKEVVPQSQLYPMTSEPLMVALTSPLGSANPCAGDSINLAATASDADNRVQKVEFYANGTKIGESSTTPYALSWNGADAGDVTIVAKALNDAGDVSESAPVTIPVSAVGTGLRGEYYDDEGFSQSKFSRVDPQINFDWNIGAPDPSMGADTFSIRWTGQIRVPKTEAFTFYSLVDDGARVWVDGQLISERWPYGGVEVVSTPINLVAGRKYAIKVEFHEGIIHAKAQLSWSSATTPKAVIPAAYLYPASAGQPAVSVTAFNTTLSERSGATGLWRLTRTGSTSDPVSVNIVLAGSAVNGVDYDLTPTVVGNQGTVVIPAGQAFIDIRISPRDDSLYEGTEQARLYVAPGADYASLGSSAPGTGSPVNILDNAGVSTTRVNFQSPNAPAAPGYEANPQLQGPTLRLASAGMRPQHPQTATTRRHNTLALLQEDGVTGRLWFQTALIRHALRRTNLTSSTT